MTHQIKTPVLAASAEALLDVINSVRSKDIDIEQAKAITAAARGIPHHVSADLKARLAAPQLAKIESGEAG